MLISFTEKCEELLTFLLDKMALHFCTIELKILHLVDDTIVGFERLGPDGLIYFKSTDTYRGGMTTLTINEHGKI